MGGPGMQYGGCVRLAYVDHRHPTVLKHLPREIPAYNMSVAKFKRKDIASRNTLNNANIIIDNIVYDVSKFHLDHPGGSKLLLDNAGKDVSMLFHDVRHSKHAFDWRKEFAIGEVEDEDKWEVKPFNRAAQEQRLRMDLFIAVFVAHMSAIVFSILFYWYVLR